MDSVPPLPDVEQGFDVGSSHFQEGALTTGLWGILGPVYYTEAVPECINY